MRHEKSTTLLEEIRPMYVSSRFLVIRGHSSVPLNYRCDICLLRVFDNTHAICASNGGNSNTIGISQNLLLDYWHDGGFRQLDVLRCKYSAAKPLYKQLKAFPYCTIFQHAVVAIMSDNNASLPMLIPAFFSLCTAMIFGPVSRYRLVLCPQYPLTSSRQPEIWRHDS